MGKFQLNKKGDDPIKIYEDVFKISQGTVESHLGKLGKQSKASEVEDICPICKGTGESDIDDSGIKTGLWIYKCPRCDGTGKIDAQGGFINEAKASELTDIEKAKKRLAMQGDGSGMDGNSYGLDLEEPYRDLDEESLTSEWNSVEAITSEFYNDTGDAGRFLETPQLQQIRNHWDNVMPEEEKRSMLEGMAFLYKSSPTQKFDSLNWEVKESVALSVAGLVGLSIDMGTLYGKQHLDDLQNMYWD